MKNKEIATTETKRTATENKKSIYINPDLDVKIQEIMSARNIKSYSEAVGILLEDYVNLNVHQEKIQKDFLQKITSSRNHDISYIQKIAEVLTVQQKQIIKTFEKILEDDEREELNKAIYNSTFKHNAIAEFYREIKAAPIEDIKEYKTTIRRMEEFIKNQTEIINSKNEDIKELKEMIKLQSEDIQSLKETVINRTKDISEIYINTLLSKKNLEMYLSLEAEDKSWLKGTNFKNAIDNFLAGKFERAYMFYNKFFVEEEKELRKTLLKK